MRTSKCFCSFKNIYNSSVWLKADNECCSRLPLGTRCMGKPGECESGLKCSPCALTQVGNAKNCFKAKVFCGSRACKTLDKECGCLTPCP